MVVRIRSVISKVTDYSARVCRQYPIVRHNGPYEFGTGGKRRSAAAEVICALAIVDEDVGLLAKGEIRIGIPQVVLFIVKDNLVRPVTDTRLTELILRVRVCF